MGHCGGVVLVTLALFCFFVSVKGEANFEDDFLFSLAANHDYKDALGKGILFFEGQRSGKLPSSQRVTWRGDSALSDGKPEGANLVGGYYDAGDNVKFVWPMAFSVCLLSWAAVEYQQEISSANQLKHLRDAIRWGADFILEAHTSPTTLYTQVGDGNSDHQCWERPEDMDTSRALFKITSNSPGSEAAAEAAAALAAASIVFKGVDSNYSSRLLRNSESTNIEDLTKVLVHSTAHTLAISCLILQTNIEDLTKVLVHSIAHTLAISETPSQEFYGGKKDLEKYKNDIESFICAVMPGSSSVQIRTTPGGLLYTRDSSNLQYVTTVTMALLIHSKTISAAQSGGVQCGSAKFSASQIRAFAKSQVDYILGNNPMKTSYMVGFGSKYPTQLHHRGASIPSIRVHPTKVGCNEGQNLYFSSTKPNPNIHVGALVGGPNSNDQFNDVRSDYSHLEPTSYINAAFVGSVAAFLAENNENYLQLSRVKTTAELYTANI
ncbi:hypothetical protein L484_006703 [Morus notabilis]|uniref:Endoglucanase n=1 Tax=Morus notabilis TaxID=981085 RepID=W9SB89_9ROSA|nr:hypothetical protein L484_006703 [Morus notabilis]